ncbi:MAG: hypothetical protein ACE5JD_14965 [Candidatus Methylomirabilia bacterium]
MEGVWVRPLDRKEDARGWLLKFLMRPDLTGREAFGEIYIISALPGVARANHYHRRTTEWFCLLRGEAKLALCSVENGDRLELALRAEAPRVVQVSPGIAHAVQNVGEGPMELLAYADEPYNPQDPDAVPFRLID